MDSVTVDSVTVVIATRDRRAELLSTLDRLVSLPEPAAIVVVDNASSDGTVEAVRDHFPGVEVVPLPANEGAAARNAGARRARTPLVAFCDDDSWWEPGALGRAQALFASHPRLGLLAARVVVEPAGTTDPTCDAMACSPLRSAVHRSSEPYPQVVGFLACAAVVRRPAFLGVGGFRRELMVGGEEALVAIDLAVAGWDRAYVPEVVAHHRPSPSRDPAGRRRLEVRNALWTAWARRPLPAATFRTVAVLRSAWSGPPWTAGVRAGVLGALDAVAGASWARRHRRPVPGPVEAALAAVERTR